MKKTNKQTKAYLEIKNISVSGSLGLLAFGDIAFEQWRKVKIENNIYKREYEEGKKTK